MSDTSNISKLLVTVNQAAEMLSISTEKIYRATVGENPSLPSVKLGRRRLISTATLEAIATGELEIR